MPLTDTRRTELDKLVHSNKVVLFMKGNRHFPQCGFSATVVSILDRLVKGYATVDILRDPEVRQDMKEFSSWPTFPQLYVNGEFVGGCDIVKELDASGELPQVLGVEAKKVEAPKVTITAGAAKALTEALAGAGDEVLRLEIDAGFACDLHVGPKVAGDFAVTSSGVTLHVARASAERASGISIDYVTGPQGAGFKIDNPNAPPGVKPLAPKVLKEMLDKGEVELFDVRPEIERAKAKIAQARALDAEGQKHLLALDREHPVAFYCHHGIRSRAAAEEVLREGFTKVYNLEGGIAAWSRDVDPSVPQY
jgi:monothiol glutaredoxin